MDASQVSEDISKTTNHNKDYEGFYDSLKRGAELLLNIPKNKNIRVIGHLDADGICSAAILISALIKLNRKYSLTILPTITEESLNDIREDHDEYIVFVDLGSGTIDIVGRVLDNKHIFILDHHILQSNNTFSNIIQMNPHLYGVDGSSEISGAGTVFLFTQYLTGNKNTEMSRIAIVGAIGDIQEREGFSRLNNEILDIAVKNHLIEVRRGLKFFGVQTKPLYKLLQYSSDIIIPGVTGSESGSISFLQNIDINPKNNKGWRKISDLTEDEKKKLVAAILVKRINRAGSIPQDIFTNTYLLIGEVEDSPFRDAKEFATLLNSCGRLNRASLGIGACLNDKKMKEMAVNNLLDYRKELVSALNWYRDNSDTGRIIKKKGYIIINAEDEVMPTIIGTLGSILSKSQDIEKNTFILSLARNHDDTTKISLRIVGNPETINLKEIIESMISKINHGTSGGHSFAAGAVIDTDYEEKFLKAAEEILGEINIEEQI